MKRSTALLLALATLLAHALTIGEDATGRLGPPDDRAWVAFRLGRHALDGLGPVWNPGSELSDVYPSWAWVALAWLSELFGLAPATTAQALGIASAALCVVLVSRFSPDRLAGVIAPLLLVLSGTLAAAATRGTELCSFAALLCAALLALETGRRRTLMACLFVLPLVRDEGILCAFALAALAIASRLKPRGTGEPLPPQASVPLTVFGLPLATFGAMAFIRNAWTGEWLSSTSRHLLQLDGERLSDGWLYLREYFLRGGAPLLVVLPVLFLFLGRTSPRGRRALALGLFWCALLVAEGGDTLPFHSALAPAVPLLYVAIQEALIEGVDSRSLLKRGVAWGLFLLGLASSTVVSRLPANLGPIPLSDLTYAWLYPEDSEFEERFGLLPARLGMSSAIERDARLRSIGRIARESFAPGTRIASPWPGALGYLSDQDVLDWFGRATTLRGADLPSAWAGPPRTDLADLFEFQPELVVITDLFAVRPPMGGVLVRDWIEDFDVEGPSSTRTARIASAIREYELISLPIASESGENRPYLPDPLYLLRLRRDAVLPELELTVFAGRYVARATHRGHAQIVDLEITGTDVAGEVWSLQPTGEFVPRTGVHARAGLLLRSFGDRDVRLIEGELPVEPQFVELQAVLRNPGSQDEELFSTASRRSIVKVLPTRR